MRDRGYSQSDEKTLQNRGASPRLWWIYCSQAIGSDGPSSSRVTWRPMTQIRNDTVEAPDGLACDATVVLPDSSRGPGIMLLQEIYGVGEFILERAQLLAEAGYVVLCPDVFFRVERNISLPHTEESLAQAFGYMERFSAIDPAVTAGDLLAGLARLRALPEVDGRPAGVMGYCLGGRLAYEAAVAGQPDCLVSYYGSGIADRLDVADQVTCPAIFHFGGQDPFIPLEQAEQVRSAFGGRSDVEVHVQPDAGHAFENSFAPQFSNPQAAARSWPLTMSFLARVLPIS